MKKNIVAWAFALLCAATPALAEKQSPPPAETPKPFSVPTTKDFLLDNGLAVTLVPFGAIPKVNATLTIHAGNIEEGPGEDGLADIVGNLLQEGTTTRSAADIAHEAAKMGGSVSTSVGSDETSIEAEALSDFAPMLLRLLADVAINPKLPASEVPRLAGDLIRSTSMRQSRPSAITEDKALQLLYPGQPYGRPLPTEATIRSHTAEKARSFYARLYGAKRAHLYVVGRFDAAATESALRSAFAAMPSLEAPRPISPKAISSRAITLIDRPGAVQSVVVITSPVVEPSHPDALALSVADTLLGGYFGSRITANIREQKGYTYSPYSYIADMQGTSFWEQYAEITTNVTGPAMKEIFAEIDRLQAEAPSEEELLGVKRYLIGTFTLRNSTRSGITRSLSFVDQHGLSRSYLATYIDRVLALKADDVRRAAKQYIDDDKATIVVLGDRKQIEEQFKPFGKIQ